MVRCYWIKGETMKKDALEYLEKNLDLKELVPNGFMPEVIINSCEPLDKTASKIIKLIPKIKASEEDIEEYEKKFKKFYKELKKLKKSKDKK
jgi:hypothetical protein